MKHAKFLTAAGLSIFFAVPVFAGNEVLAESQVPASVVTPSQVVANVVSPESSHCESQGKNLPSSDRNALLLACLAKASSPENVNAIAMQQKVLNCNQNAKNKRLQGSKKEGYLTTCLYKNEAILALESFNQRFASSDINEMLRQSPTAAGNR